MARRSATNRDIDALRAIAAAGGSMMAANRAFGRRRGFAEYWATREGISFASHRGSQKRPPDPALARPGLGATARDARASGVACDVDHAENVAHMTL
jgi:hypothetical protein